MSENIILCEGAGDCAFFSHLIKSRELPQFEVIYPNDKEDRGLPGGRGGFTSRLQALRAERRNIKGILIASDNDDNPSQSFTNVQKQIRDASGFAVPNAPMTPARLDNSATIMVMMLPGNGVAGNLETLCLSAMCDRHTAIAECTERFSECAGTNSWGVGRRSKMRLRAMISAVCKSDPNTSLRYAWNRYEEMIPLSHEVFNPVVNALRNFDVLITSGNKQQ